MMTPLLLASVALAPLLALLLCLGLSRRARSRLLGLIGAGGLAAALAALLVLWANGLPIESGALRWASLDTMTVALQMRVDPLNAPLLGLLLGGGALTMTFVALAFAPSTRGFGGLFAAMLLAVIGAALALLSVDPLLVPLGWGLAALSGYRAARAAGASEGEGDLPGGIVVSLVAALALLVALVLSLPAGEGAPPVFGIAATLCLVVLALAAFGLPPLHASIAGGVSAPAGIAALTAGLTLPLLGGHVLLRLGGSVAQLPAPWPGLLVALGLAAMLLASAAALTQRALRPLLGWQLSAQWGAVLVAVAAGGPAGLPAALALLLNAGLLGLSGFLALALLERRAGRDTIAELPRLRAALPLAGLAFGVAALSGLGLPPTWGFWGRLWLVEALQARFPWAVALCVVGTALGALAWLAPLVAFWRAEAEPPAEGARTPDEALPPLAAAVILALGIRPQLLDGSIAAAQGLVPAAEAPLPLPGPLAQAALALVALALVAAALYARPLPPSLRLEDERSSPPTPQGLAASLDWLARAADASRASALLWQGLLLSGAVLRQGLALFERRYYLAGVLLALISTILLMAQ